MRNLSFLINKFHCVPFCTKIAAMEISIIQSGVDGEISKRKNSRSIQRLWTIVQKCICPTKRQINLYFTKILILLFLCATLYGVLNERVLPGSEIFALFILAITSFLFGKILGLTKIPPLVGMLLTGFLFRNINNFPYYHHISKETSTALRGIALCYILLRAGFGLERSSLNRLKSVVMRLTFLPCLVEVVITGVLARYLLNLPWVFSFMLGFITSAVSPAVVLPPILKLKGEHYGTEKGIPTLIIAATSLDDVLAISGFTVCFSIAFSQGNLTWIVVRGPLEPLVGFAFGAVFGVILWHFPSSRTATALLVYYNVLLVSLGSMTAMFLSRKFHIPGSGPVACITMSFVASVKWRKNPEQLEDINSVILLIWLLIEPFLFSLIGAEVTIDNLKKDAGFAICVIICALLFRIVVTGLVSYGANLNIKEKLFICISWLPKATVQAAVGSQILDYARSKNKGEEFQNIGITILNVAVLSIVLTAPVGAVLMTVLGPFLLTKDKQAIISAKEEDAAKIYKTESAKKNLLSNYGSCSLLRFANCKLSENISFQQNLIGSAGSI